MKTIAKIHKKIGNNEFTIKVYPEFESVGGDFDFGSEKENQAYLERFESGELLNVIIEVMTCSNSALVDGKDRLGMCHVRAQPLKEDVLELAKNNDMFENALNDLKDSLEIIKNEDLIQLKEK